MRVTVDPNTVPSGFDYVPDGVYELEVVGSVYAEKNYPFLKWEFKIADPNIKGVKGGNPGHIYDITTLKEGENSQFRLRGLVDALGIEWADFDTEDVVGATFSATLTSEEYNKITRNIVDNYIAVKK